MKVLTSPDGSTILTIPTPTDATAHKWVGLTDHKLYERGVITDRPEPMVRRAMVTGLADVPTDGKAVFDHPLGFSDDRSVMRDLKWLAKALADAKDGAEIGLESTARGYKLNVPQDARVDRTAGLKVGSLIAVGPNVSPRQLMNARGTVVSIKGAKASVEFDARDLERVCGVTGKKFTNPVPMHKSTLEVIG